MFALEMKGEEEIGFSSSHVWNMRVGPYGRLNTEELMVLNYGAGEDF